MNEYLNEKEEIKKKILTTEINYIVDEVNYTAMPNNTAR